MPLIKSPKRKYIWINAREMMRAGHKRAQAFAAAYEVARRAGMKISRPPVRKQKGKHGKA